MSMPRHTRIFLSLIFLLSLLISCNQKQQPNINAGGNGDNTQDSARVQYVLGDISSQGVASGSGITLSFEKEAEWEIEDGKRAFIASVTVRNQTGKWLKHWDLNFNAAFDIKTMWGSTFAEANDTFTITPKLWNRYIRDGHSRTFGFQGVYSGDFQEPTAYVISGIPLVSEDTGAISASCEVETEFVPTFSWGLNNNKKFTAEMLVKNTGTKAVNWQLTFKLDADITAMWHASYKQENGMTIITPDSWNVRIEAGETRSFGFIANYQGDTIPQPQEVICGTQGSNPEVNSIGTFYGKVPQSLDSLTFSREGDLPTQVLTASSPQWTANNHNFASSVTVTNITDKSLNNVRAIISARNPSNTTVLNPDGYTSEGHPFIDIGTLESQATKTVPLRFYNPEDKEFTFTVTLLEIVANSFTLASATPNSFPADAATTVTVNGQGIRAETAFFIQSNQLEVQSWTENAAVLKVPAGFTPAKYGIMAINPNGDKATLYPAFTITKGADVAALDPKAFARSFVEGYVVDYKTNKPIVGATVSIPGLSAKTGPTGYYLLRGLPTGEHAVKVEADGYEPVYRFANVTSAQHTTVLRVATLQPRSEAVTNIGAAGGTHYANNGAFIVIPEGALSETVPIQFTHTEAAGTLPELPQDGYYLAFAKLRPTGLVFNKPATLYLPLQQNVILPEGTPIRISYFDENNKRWVQDITAGVIKKINDRLFLEYEINHFTWIGGSWFPDTVTGCVRYADGRPAAGISTNYGVTDSAGNFRGSTTSAEIGRNLTARAYYDGEITSKSIYYDGNGGVSFACIILPAPEKPDFSKFQLELKPDPKPSNSPQGCSISAPTDAYFSTISPTLSLLRQEQPQLTTSPSHLMTSSSSVKTRLVTPNEFFLIQTNTLVSIRIYIQDYSKSGVIASEITFNVGGDNSTSNIDINYPVIDPDSKKPTDVAEIVLRYDTSPSKGGSYPVVANAPTRQPGQVLNRTLEGVMFHDIEVPRIRFLSIPSTVDTGDEYKSPQKFYFDDANGEKTILVVFKKEYLENTTGAVSEVTLDLEFTAVLRDANGQVIPINSPTDYFLSIGQSSTFLPVLGIWQYIGGVSAYKTLAHTVKPANIVQGRADITITLSKGSQRFDNYSPIAQLVLGKAQTSNNVNGDITTQQWVKIPYFDDAYGICVGNGLNTWREILGLFDPEQGIACIIGETTYRTYLDMAKLKGLIDDLLTDYFSNLIEAQGAERDAMLLSLATSLAEFITGGDIIIIAREFNRALQATVDSGQIVGVDPILMSMAVAGLILDFVPSCQIAGFGMTAIAKLYRAVSGLPTPFLKEYMAIIWKPFLDALDTSDPQALTRAMSNALEKFPDIAKYTDKPDVLRRISELGETLAKRMGTEESVEQITKALNNIEDVGGTTIEEFLDQANQVADIKGFDNLLKKVQDAGDPTNTQGVMNEMRRGARLKATDGVQNLEFPDKNFVLDDTSPTGFRPVERDVEGSIEVDTIFDSGGIRHIEDVKGQFRSARNDRKLRDSAKKMCRMARAAKAKTNLEHIGQIAFSGVYEPNNLLHVESVRQIEIRGSAVVDATGRRIRVISESAFEEARTKCTSGG